MPGRREALTAPDRTRRSLVKHMVRIGDKLLPWHEGLSLAEALKMAGFGAVPIIVRVDGRILAKREWAGLLLANGANVEVAVLSAGG